jgi:hypothetical protein
MFLQFLFRCIRCGFRRSPFPIRLDRFLDQGRIRLLLLLLDLLKIGFERRDLRPGCG